MKLVKATLQGKEICIEFDFCNQMLEKVKGIKGRRFSKKPKAHWLVSIETYPQVEELASVAGFQISIAPEVTKTYRNIINKKAAATRKKAAAYEKLLAATNMEAPLPCGWTLFKHQKESIHWGLQTLCQTRLDGVIYALDMGLGKTLCALVTAKAYQVVFGAKVVVVCPASLKENWAREAVGVGVDIEIVSWNKIPDPPKKDYIFIADEAHYAQNACQTSQKRSQRGEAFLNMAKGDKILAGLYLTGTPLRNGRPCHLFPLLFAAGHPLSADQREYELEYCDAKATPFTRWDTNGAKNLDVLHKNIQDVILYKKKEECIDLPPKTRIFRQAEVKGASLKAYKSAHKEAEKEYLKSKDLDKPEAAIVFLIRLRAAASKAKVESGVELAKDILEEGRQVVIFTEFRETVDLLHKALGGEILTGDTPIEERQVCVDRFQSGESKVFISTSGAGGVGITLTKASDVILLDRPWTPGDARQAEDRVYRIGQERKVMAYWMQFGQADERIDSLLQTKEERISFVLEGKRKTMRGVSMSKKQIAAFVCDEIFAGKPKK